ncbi:MAG: hypothetical protein ACI9LX_003962 [Paraglaciecola sp.]|jgi:hypothetical protein
MTFYFTYTQAMLSHILRYALVGSPQTVADTRQKARLKSAEMFAKLM